jgi:4a-hydroxytetrahydrobiopterin dehydratase
MVDEPAHPEGWNEVRGALQRGYRFSDFKEAIAFVNRLAEAAEAADHHPDILISWNTVTVRWWTHVKRAITDRDAEMARRTDELAGQSARGAAS